jgi:TonB family protein
MVYPQVRPGTIGGPESDFNTMEIVVSERGLVEQVRLLSTPRRMTDMMLLSGAKTWRFEPATMNGSAVRYRMEITWPTTR